MGFYLMFLSSLFNLERWVSQLFHGAHGSKCAQSIPSHPSNSRVCLESFLHLWLSISWRATCCHVIWWIVVKILLCTKTKSHPIIDVLFHIIQCRLIEACRLGNVEVDCKVSCLSRSSLLTAPTRHISSLMGSDVLVYFSPCNKNTMTKSNLWETVYFGLQF